jgi:hypothetical protein
MPRVLILLCLACSIGAAAVHSAAAQRTAGRSADCDRLFVEAASPLAPTLAITIL